MNFKRRDFVKGSFTAIALTGSGLSIAATDNKPNQPSSVDVASIQKSIQAYFGGSFSLLSHQQSGNLIVAKIESFGNQFTASSTNLLDWKVTQSSLPN